MKNSKKILLALVLIAVFVTVLASCTTVDNVGKTYKIAVFDGGGVTVDDFVADGRIVEPAVLPKKAGYEFLGWYLDKDYTTPVIFGEPLTKDIRIYGLWKENLTHGTFIVGGNEESIKVKADKGLITPPTVEREGYEFLGWYVDKTLKTKADFTTAINSDTTYYAGWEMVQYRINYDCDGLADNALGTKYTYTVEDKVVLLDPINVQSGYEFLGWVDQDGEAVVEIKAGSVGDVNVKAQFLSHNKEVASVWGGSVNDGKVFIGIQNSITSINFSEIISVSDRASYVVSDKDGNKIVTAEDLQEGDTEFVITVTAEDGTSKNFDLIVTRYDDSKVQIIYLFPDDTATRSFVSKGERALEIVDKEIVGYSYAGWYNDNERTSLYDFNLPVLSNIVIYAKYNPIDYTISYHTGIWELNVEAVVTYTVEDYVFFIAPTANGNLTKYEFEGWYLSDGETKVRVIHKGTIGNIDLYAHYVVSDVNKIDAFGNYNDADTILEEEIYSFMDWCIYNKRTSTNVKFSIPQDKTDGYLASVLETENARASAFEWVKTMEISGSYSTDDGRANYEVEFIVTYQDMPSIKASEEDRYPQLSYNMHSFSSDRAKDYEGFKINYIDSTVSCTDSNQLVYVVTNGYRPIPEKNSSAERMYNKAKSVLREIVTDNMSDVEKAHAIYDWIVLNVAYDYDLLEISNSEGFHSIAKQYNGFALEGVFDDHRAVCDGISKAFALMCNIEGIPCVQVVGHRVANGEGHAWNKFLIDGKWYNADPTSGGLLLSVISGDDKTSKEGLSHGFFMLTDETMNKINTPDNGINGQQDKIADTNYNLYKTQIFTVGTTDYDCQLAEAGDWYGVALYIATLTESDTVIDLGVYSGEEATINSDLDKALQSAGVSVRYALFYDEATSSVIIWILSL